MATLDIRTRTSRRTARRVHWDLPEVPEDSALACGESGEDCSPCGEELRLLPGGKEAPETAKPLATIDEDGGLVAGSAAMAGAPRSMLRSLPTPARSRAAALQVRAARAGPEPWNLPDASAPAEALQASGRTSSYRELLQLRGQQAMHRSLRTSAASRSSPTAAAASPTVAGVASPVSLLAAVPTPAPAPTLMLAPAVAAAAAQQQALAIPACSQQLSFFTGGGAFQLGQLSPASGQQSPVAAPECGVPLSRPEELMATLLPGAPSLDKEQIAEQLAAAAPDCYDD